MLAKIFRISLIILSILPLGLVVNVFAFYFHAQYELGHFPTYDHPDPKSLGFHSYYEGWSIVVFAWGFVISMWTWPAAFVGYVINHRKNINWKLLVLSVLSYGSIFLLLFSGAFGWYLD